MLKVWFAETNHTFSFCYYTLYIIYARNAFMKKTILTLCALVMVSVAMAEPISSSKAASIAKQTLKGVALHQVQMVSSEGKARVSGFSASAPAFYIFNSDEEEGGFAIIAGDDEFPAVLGYSTSGNIQLDRPLPDGLLAYLEFLTEYVADVQAGRVAAPRKGSSTAGTPVVSPLLATKWGQDNPYNLLCPKAGSTVCPVGCVATSMAQVMKFWKWPEHGRGVLSYTSEGIGTLSLNFENSVYDWDNMYNTALQNAKSTARKDAVSKLSYDCGIASRMQYGAGGSGTTLLLARIALGRYLGYAASKMQHYYRDCYDGTQEQWNKMIYNELKAGRPIIYAAQSEGSGRDAGHCFVFDGYDSNGYVHVNWGWDGSSDGYYAITVLDPDGTGYRYTSWQEMLTNITPDREWNDDKEDQVPMRMVESPTIGVESAALGAEFTVQIHGIYNYSGNTRSYFIGVGLFDWNGNLLEVIGQTDNRIGLNYYYGYNSLDMPCRIKGSYAEDTYVISVIEKQYSTSAEYEWIKPSTVGGSRNNWIPTYIHDKAAFFNQVSSAINAPEADEKVVSHQYFDLSGRPVQNVTKGVVIERKTTSNGEQKVLKRRF